MKDVLPMAINGCKLIDQKSLIDDDYDYYWTYLHVETKILLFCVNRVKGILDLFTFACKLSQL